MKVIIGSLIGLLVITFIVSRLINTTSSRRESNPTPSITTIPSLQEEAVEKEARFTIVTGTITRNFSAAKYHNQSKDVYIEATDPSVVHVKKAGITWDNFFETLPMKLTDNCLVTGDGERLCDGDTGTLTFYLNDKETPDLLYKEIQNADNALIKFTYK